MQRCQMTVLLLFVSLVLIMNETPVWAIHSTSAPFARVYSEPNNLFPPVWLLASSVHQTKDGGFIVVGSLLNRTIGVQTWLLKLDATGGIVWQKAYALCRSCSFGGIGDLPHALQTHDGGFLVETTVTVSSTTMAAAIFKVDSSGTLIWQKAFTGLGNATGSSIDLMPDGGLILAGSTTAAKSFLGSFLPNSRAWVVKLDRDGGMEWQETYAGVGQARAFAIGRAFEGGYIIGGSTNSSDGAFRAWSLRIDSSGRILWQNTFTQYVSGLASIAQTSDGGFIGAGEFTSPAISTQALVLRLSGNGAPVWQMSYSVGAVQTPTSQQTQFEAFSIQQIRDGGYIVAGTISVYCQPSSCSFGGGNCGGTCTSSALVLRLDGLGNILWQEAFGTGLLGRYFAALSVQQTSDRGFIVAGYAPSYIDPVGDAFIMKLGATGQLSSCNDQYDPGLISSTLSGPATSISGVAMAITSQPITITFASAETDATTIVLCFRPLPPKFRP